MSGIGWGRVVCIVVWSALLSSCAAASCLPTGQSNESNLPPPSISAQIDAPTKSVSSDQAAPAPRDDASSAANSQEASATPTNRLWHYGAFFDLGYLRDFSDPANHLFRNRGTTPRVNELDLNMAAVSFRKDASTSSRWGAELLLQAGEDSKIFGFSATAPDLAGSNWLRQLGGADVSYLAPIGKGLTLQAGIFNSLIGYDSLYAKDNFSYTRPWGADYTPYLMMGVTASYPFTQKLTGTFCLVNGYWHLADANNVPSVCGQVAYSATQHLTFKQTLLYGPHQSDTSIEFWRVLSDSIAEWKRAPMTIAFEYQFANEKLATPGNPRAQWMAAQLPVHWAIHGPWALTVRPEFAWDRDGRWIGFPQTIKAVTSTVEYRVPYRWTTTILRLEYRYDDSRGKTGGFFKDGQVQPGVDQLTPTQHLLVFGFIWTLESR